MHRFISLFAAATIAASPALAQDQERVTVRHADLDLASATGRAKFDRRVAVATERVCGSYMGAAFDRVIEIDKCRTGVRRSVAAQLASYNRQQVALR